MPMLGVGVRCLACASDSCPGARLPVRALLFSFSIFNRAENIFRCHCSGQHYIEQRLIFNGRFMCRGWGGGERRHGAGGGARGSAGRVSRIVQYNKKR